MKKMLFVLMAVLVIALPTAMVFAAESDLVLAFGEPVFNEDGTVTVDLVIEENPGFCILSFYLDYDQEILVDVEAVNKSNLAMTAGFGYVFSQNSGDYTQTGTLMTFTFTLAEDAPHATFPVTLLDGVNFEGTPNRDCVNYDEEVINVEVRDAAITIAHDLVHVEAVAPACHYDGNVEYWYCKDEACGMVCTDEAMTQVTNLKSVILPAVGSDRLVHMDAVAPGCHMAGNIEYWICYDCEQVWADEALTQLTNIKNVVLPEVGGDVVHVEAVAATCGVNGNNEHWYCDECGQVWADEARTQLTNRLNVVIPALEHEFDEKGICGLCGAESDLFVSADVGVDSVYFGQTFTVDVVLDRNHGFTFLSLDVLYDTDAFELVEVSNGVIIENLESGAHLVWSCAYDVTTTGVLATLTFEVKADAKSDSYEVSFACNEAWKESEEAATFVCAGDSIDILMYGDVNGDGKINSADVTRLLRYLANRNPVTGESEVEVSLGTDVNGDGKITSLDVTRLLRYLANRNPVTGESSVVLGPAK
ncbi:MAG: hypothetical protein IJD82_03175 [Clostridia bacterium]|nr:hypothetical protein [Clostridia bacterium]